MSSVPYRCVMNHLSHLDPDVDRVFLADLAGGWHFCGTCPICDRSTAMPLSPDEALEYEVAGVPVLEDSRRLRSLLNTHAIKKHEALTPTVVDGLMGTLTNLEPLEADALIGTWLGTEAPHV